jgi:hypothetical protein
MIKLPLIYTVATRDPALEITAAFFHEHASAILNAALQRGGPAAQRRCLQLLSEIAESSSLSRSLKLELVWLHQQIASENVGDPNSADAARYGMLDPMDPRSEELRLETAHLFDLLVTISELHPGCDVISQTELDLTVA